MPELPKAPKFKEPKMTLRKRWRLFKNRKKIREWIETALGERQKAMDELMQVYGEKVNECSWVNAGTPERRNVSAMGRNHFFMRHSFS